MSNSIFNTSAFSKYIGLISFLLMGYNSIAQRYFIPEVVAYDFYSNEWNDKVLNTKERKFKVDLENKRFYWKGETIKMKNLEINGDTLKWTHKNDQKEIVNFTFSRETFNNVLITTKRDKDGIFYYTHHHFVIPMSKVISGWQELPYEGKTEFGESTHYKKVELIGRKTPKGGKTIESIFVMYEDAKSQIYRITSYPIFDEPILERIPERITITLITPRGKKLQLHGYMGKTGGVNFRFEEYEKWKKVTQKSGKYTVNYSLPNDPNFYSLTFIQ